VDPEDGLLVYLGSHSRVDYVGLLLPQAEPAPLAGGGEWAGLREVAAGLPDLDAGLAVTATALAVWHGRAGFCPGCGSPTAVTSAGWVRRCQAEGQDLFPRTDPAVIVSITDREDRLLLARARHFPPGRVSVLAGFVEAGESLEAAVHREVAEEVGICLGAVSYLGSQPWPFPSSLMCAFEAKALDTDLTVDPAELAEAGWYSRAAFAAGIAAGDIRVASRSAIARSQIERWYGRPVDQP
jgi:NAD+ diphosphatase